MTEKPRVLFVCIHNAGRSQMAAGYATALSGGAIDVRSGGSEPGDEINRVAIAVMAEEGIDISGAIPQLMTSEAVRDSEVIVTMGCGDACPNLSRQTLRGLGPHRSARPADCRSACHPR